MIRWIIILLFVCSKFSVFSQESFSDTTKYPVIVKTPSGISLVIMTRAQANNGYKAFLKVDELTERLKNAQLGNDTCVSGMRTCEQRADNLLKIHSNDSIIISAERAKVKLYSDQLDKTKKQVRRQKVQKWLAITGAVIIAGLAIIF